MISGANGLPAGCGWRKVSKLPELVGLSRRSPQKYSASGEVCHRPKYSDHHTVPDALDFHPYSQEPYCHLHRQGYPTCIQNNANVRFIMINRRKKTSCIDRSGLPRRLAVYQLVVATRNKYCPQSLRFTSMQRGKCTNIIELCEN